MGAEVDPKHAGKLRDPLSPQQASRVLDDLLTGVTLSHGRLGGRFPLYRSSGREWVSSRRGSWTGGMWAGLLWLRALRSGTSEDVSSALRAHLALDVWSGADTATRGLILWYPLALSRLVAVPDRHRVESIARRGVFSLLADFSPEQGVVPWGNAFGGHPELVRVDGAPGVAPLMSRASGATVESARTGARHLMNHLRGCWKGGVLTPVRALGTLSQPPGGADYWSRGRAWLLTGFADALSLGVIEPDDADLRRLLEARVPLVPAVDERAPGDDVDTGAAAIEAAALLRLADRLRDPSLARRTRERAMEIVRLLLSSHLTEDGHGLGGCSYDTREGLLRGLETVWGNFFLALTVSMIAGIVPSAQC